MSSLGERHTSASGLAAIGAAVAVSGTAATATLLAVVGFIELAGPDRTWQVGVYVGTFAVLLPLALLLGWRSLTRAQPNLAAALLTAALLPLLLCVLRLATVADAPPLLIHLAEIIGGVGLAAAAVVVALRPEGDLPGWLAVTPPRLAAISAVAACAALLPFLPAPVSWITVLLATCAGLLGWRWGPRLAGVRPPRRVQLALEVALLALVFLLAVDLTGYWGQDLASVTPGLESATVGPIAQVHQNFYLGPVTDLLHGRAMLVDSDSVYGIGVAYGVAAWFQVAPLGYGAFSLLGSLVGALMIGAGWLVMRIAGVPAAIRAAAVALGLMICILAPLTPPTLFLNIGGLRFAPPLILLAALVLAARRRPAIWSPSAAILLAAASIWSIESFVYCAGVYVAVAIAEAMLAGRRGAARLLGRGLLTAIAALAAVHALFALLTLAFAGSLPDWSMYLSLIRAWSDVVTGFFDGIVQPWSPVWAMGALYLLSAIALACICVRRGDALPRTAAVAIAGLIGAGVSSLSYFLAHPIDFFLPEIAYPAILLIGVWSSLPLRTAAPAHLATWVGAATATIAFAGILLLGGSWAAATDKLPRTALAHIVPGGPSFSHDLDLLWDSPPIDPRAVPAQELIERHFPADEALVLTEPDLGMEALIRSGRANAIGVSYPPQDEVDLPRALPIVQAALEDVEPGTPMLTQSPLPASEQPAKALEYQQQYGRTPPGARLGPLAKAALVRLGERFRFVPVERGPFGLQVVRLEPR